MLSQTSQNVREYIHQEFENLKQCSNLLKSLIENTSYGMALITADFHIVDVNSKMLEWFPGIDFQSSPVCYKCFFTASDTPCPQCPAVRSIKEGQKNSIILEVPQKNSSYKISTTPLIGPDGKAWGVLELVENITEKIAVEKDLLDLEAQYMHMIENASDAIVTFNNSGEILQINNKAQQLFGYQADEVRGKRIYCLIPEDRREDQEKAAQRIFTCKKSSGVTYEGVGLRKNSTILPIEITYSFIKTSKGDTVTAIIRDISERKDHEKKLQTYAEELEQQVEVRTRQLIQSEERYETLLSTANDAIISTDKKGNIIYLNKKAEQIYGYSKEEILGKSIAIITPAEIWETAQRAFQSSDGSTPGKVIESVGIHKNGTIFPVECTVSGFKRDGEYNLTLIARNITRRKNLEKELQQYTAKLEEKVRERTYELTASQQILKEKISELSILKEISEALSSTMDMEAVLNIILVGATSHHALGFNRAFLFLVNDERSFLEGKVAIGPSDSKEAQRIWSEIIGKKLTLGEILRSYTNKTGQVDTHVNEIIKSIRIPLTDESNILTHAVTKKESFNVRDAFSHPLVSKNLISIMNCNAFALIPLIAKDNVLGLLWADNAITKAAIDERDIERLRAFALNASLAIEKSNLYKNIQEKVAELDNANTELKENRDRLIRSEKLVAVGEMSATVAHGIRNPLVSIGGFARRLLKKEDENSINKKYLQIIVEEIDRLETILSELLDFVRPRKLKLKKVHIDKIIESTLQVFFFELEKRNIQIEKNFLDTLPKLEIDTDQVKRILHNLFNNAMDAMPEGGVLKITTEQEDTWAKISIADTGIGIADDEVEKVFHPFFTSKESGSGLGLAVCNQIVSIHGGHIKLKRQIPHGVVFDIFLPIVRPENA